MQERDLEEYRNQKPVMILSARVAHDREANSYRNFRVGACVLLRNEKGEYQTYSRGNFKRRCRDKTSPHHGEEGHICEAEPRKKCCAERLAIHRAEKEGYKFVVGIAVAGDLQLDNESLVETVLLEPCGVCRAFFKRLVRDKRMESDAPIISAHPNPEHPVQPTEQVLWQLIEKHRVGDELHDARERVRKQALRDARRKATAA